VELLGGKQCRRIDHFTVGVLCHLSSGPRCHLCLIQDKSNKLSAHLLRSHYKFILFTISTLHQIHVKLSALRIGHTSRYQRRRSQRQMVIMLVSDVSSDRRLCQAKYIPWSVEQKQFTARGLKPRMSYTLYRTSDRCSRYLFRYRHGCRYS
jgi:hypothetical protein